MVSNFQIITSDPNVVYLNRLVKSNKDLVILIPRSMCKDQSFNQSFWSFEILVMIEISFFYELSLVSRFVISKKNRYYR